MASDTSHRKYNHRNFTDEQINDIRLSYIQGYNTIRGLATTYETSIRTIHDILHLKTYSYIEPPENYQVLLEEMISKNSKGKKA